MDKEKYEKIKEIVTDFKNRSNNDLKLAMDVLQNEYETTKETIINFTYYLDNVEETYNQILNEYKKRTNT
jgi:hypothetical protein